MNESDGPKRYASAEMTAVIPREHLPPVSSKQIADLDLDPEHPETKEFVARAFPDQKAEIDDPRNRPTLVPCPAECRPCSCCAGARLVPADVAAAWRIQQANERNHTPDDAA